jgi:hypothetical protein
MQSLEHRNALLVSNLLLEEMPVKIAILLLMLFLVVLSACDRIGTGTVGEVPATPDTPPAVATRAVPKPTSTSTATPTDDL